MRCAEASAPGGHNAAVGVARPMLPRRARVFGSRTGRTCERRRRLVEARCARPRHDCPPSHDDDVRGGVDPTKKPPFSYRGLGWRVVGIGGRPELHQEDLAPKLDRVLAQIRVGRNEADERGGGIGLAIGEVSFEDGVVAVGQCRSPRPCDRSEARGPETEAGTVDNAAVEGWAQASRRVDRGPSSRLCPGSGSASVFRGLYALGLDSVAARAEAVLTCISRFYFQMRVHQRRPQASRPRDASTPLLRTARVFRRLFV